MQTVLLPLPDVGKRSTLPEEALRAVVDAVGVVDWARCAAFLNKELSRTVPQDVVISVSDFAASSDPDTKVRGGRATLSNTPFKSLLTALGASCLQGTLSGSFRRFLLLLIKETKHLRALQPAVPEFFHWLNMRLSSVRVLNVECRVLTSPRRGCHWAWPSGARLVRPSSTDCAPRLCAARLVVAQADNSHCIIVQPWLNRVARNHQQLIALCLKGFSVRALPVMPQLEVLVYGCVSHRLDRSLLDSIACQPRLVSLQLLGKWPRGVVCGSLLRLEDLTRLRLDVADLRSIQRMPVLERCTVALTLLNPDPSYNGVRTWLQHAFTSLSSLSIEWDDSHQPEAGIHSMLHALPDTVRSVDITFPQGYKILMMYPSVSLIVKPTLVALRLRISGFTNSQEPLHLLLPYNMQRLTLQVWGGHVVLHGYKNTFKSMMDMHVEAASIDATARHYPHLNVQEGWQVSARVPDETEISGGMGGQPVQVAHLGAWPPSVPGYEGPDVLGARACCYWPCACGACDICRRADFWRVSLGSG